MIKKINVYKYFLIAIMISPFLEYFSRTGIIAYGPVILLMISVIAIELTALESMRMRDWLAVLVLLPYTVLASYYYISNPLDGRYFTNYLLTIITLPFIVLSILRLAFYSVRFDYKSFVLNSVIFFLIAQLLICLGQISTYITGFGLPIIEEYSGVSMITGTFFNSNNLGAVVLMISFVFIDIEESVHQRLKLFIWLLVATLLVISGSRSALLLGGLLFLYTRRFSFKNIVFYGLLVFISFMLYGLISSSAEVSGIKINAFSRFFIRLESLVYILTNGIGVDDSVGLRLESYVHFLFKLNDLGLGSGEVNNYFKYSGGANFSTEIIFRNPHSLIVEIGYWLGWPGLIFSSVGILYLISYSNRKLLFCVVFMVVVHIPSSVLGVLIVSLFSLLSVISSRKKYYTKEGLINA
jgi:hypothetical protein